MSLVAEDNLSIEQVVFEALARKYPFYGSDKFDDGTEEDKGFLRFLIQTAIDEWLRRYRLKPVGYVSSKSLAQFLSKSEGSIGLSRQQTGLRDTPCYLLRRRKILFMRASCFGT